MALFNIIVNGENQQQLPNSLVSWLLRTCDKCKNNPIDCNLQTKQEQVDFQTFA